MCSFEQKDTGAPSEEENGVTVTWLGSMAGMIPLTSYFFQFFIWHQESFRSLYLAKPDASKEASEVLANPEGRWVCFSINNQDLVLLEKKQLPPHLQKLDNVDVPVTLQSLVCDLQDAGEASWHRTVMQHMILITGFIMNCINFIRFLCEVRVELSHHRKEDDAWVCSKPLVFVMDAVPELEVKKKGKKKSAQFTVKNFGAWMSMTKVKTALDTLKLGWRCRFPDLKYMFSKNHVSISCCELTC